MACIRCLSGISNRAKGVSMPWRRRLLFLEAPQQVHHGVPRPGRTCGHGPRERPGLLKPCEPAVVASATTGASGTDDGRSDVDNLFIVTCLSLVVAGMSKTAQSQCSSFQHAHMSQLVTSLQVG